MRTPVALDEPERLLWRLTPRQAAGTLLAGLGLLLAVTAAPAAALVTVGAATVVVAMAGGWVRVDDLPVEAWVRAVAGYVARRRRSRGKPHRHARPRRHPAMSATKASIATATLALIGAFLVAVLSAGPTRPVRPAAHPSTHQPRAGRANGPAPLPAPLLAFVRALLLAARRG